MKVTEIALHNLTNLKFITRNAESPCNIERAKTENIAVPLILESRSLIE